MKPTLPARFRTPLFVCSVIVLALLIDRFPPLPDDPVARGDKFWGRKREIHQAFVALVTMAASVVGGVTALVAIFRPRRVVVALYTACLFVTLTGSLALLRELVWPRVPNDLRKAMDFLSFFVGVGLAWMIALRPIVARRREEFLEERQGGRWGLNPPSDNS